MQSDIKSYERTLKRMNQYDNNSKDPIERVKGRIEAVCLETEIYDYENTQELIELFNDKIEHSKKQYINPTAFIFGFFVITDNKIDKKKLNEIFRNNNYSKELIDVDLVDIIRYARFWLKIQNSKVSESFIEEQIIESELIPSDESVENRDEDENDFVYEDENDFVYEDENDFVYEDDDNNGAAEYKQSGKYDEW